MNLLKVTSSPTSPATVWLHYNRKVPKIDSIQLYSERGPQKNSFDQLDNINKQTKQKTTHKQKTTVKTTVSRYEQRNLIKLNKNNYRVLISLISLLIIRT